MDWHGAGLFGGAVKSLSDMVISRELTAEQAAVILELWNDSRRPKLDRYFAFAFVVAMLSVAATVAWVMP